MGCLLICWEEPLHVMQVLGYKYVRFMRFQHGRQLIPMFCRHIYFDFPVEICLNGCEATAYVQGVLVETLFAAYNTYSCCGRSERFSFSI